MADWIPRGLARALGISSEQVQARRYGVMAEIEQALQLSWLGGVTPEQHIVAARVIAESHRGHLTPQQINWLEKNPECSDLVLGGPYGALLPPGRNATHHRQHERERSAGVAAPRELDAPTTSSTERQAEASNQAPWPEQLFVLRTQEGVVYGTASLEDPELTRLVVDVSVASGFNPPAVPKDAYELLCAEWSQELDAATGKTGAMAVVLHRLPTDDEVTPNALLDLLMTLAQHAPQVKAVLHLPAELMQYAGRCNEARHQRNYGNPGANLAEVLLQEKKPPEPVAPHRSAVSGAQAAAPGAFATEWRPPGNGTGPGHASSS